MLHVRAAAPQAVLRQWTRGPCGPWQSRYLSGSMHQHRVHLHLCVLHTQCHHIIRHTRWWLDCTQGSYRTQGKTYSTVQLQLSLSHVENEQALHNHPAGSFCSFDPSRHSRKHELVSPLAAAGNAACAAAAAFESHPTAASATWESCCVPRWLGICRQPLLLLLLLSFFVRRRTRSLPYPAHTPATQDSGLLLSGHCICGIPLRMLLKSCLA